MISFLNCCQTVYKKYTSKNLSLEHKLWNIRIRCHWTPESKSPKPWTPETKGSGNRRIRCSPPESFDEPCLNPNTILIFIIYWVFFFNLAHTGHIQNIITASNHINQTKIMNIITKHQGISKTAPCFNVLNNCSYLMVKGSKSHHRVHLKLFIEKTTFIVLVLCVQLHDYPIHSSCSRIFFHTDEFDVLLSYFLYMNETVHLELKVNKIWQDMALTLVIHFPKNLFYLNCCEGYGIRGNHWSQSEGDPPSCVHTYYWWISRWILTLCL